MTWTTLQPADLTARFSPAEISALARATGDLDDAVLAEVLAQTVAMVRGYCAAAHDVVMGSVGVPPALRGAALDLAVVAYATRAGGSLLDPKGLRKEAREAAIRLLQDVAAGKFTIEDPDETDAVPVSTHPGPSIEDPESVL